MNVPLLHPSLCQVPPGWSIQRLRTLLVLNSGGAWGEEVVEGGTIVLRSTVQSFDGVWNITDPARCLLTSSQRDEALLRAGDLVITKSSGSSLHIGKTTIVTAEIESLHCCFSNFMQRLRVNHLVLCHTSNDL